MRRLNLRHLFPFSIPARLCALLLVLAGTSGLLFVRRAPALAMAKAAAPFATITVTTVTDENNTNPSRCSLREAITAANTNAAFGGCAAGAAGLDTINFQIITVNHTIDVGATGFGALPTITEPVVLDGDLGGGQRVELNGAAAGANTSGLVIVGNDSSTIRSLVINRFSSVGIYLQGVGNTVRNCYLGTDQSGGAALANGLDGILVTGSFNVIGGNAVGAGNVISGNAFSGVSFFGAGSGNRVEGNFIGTNASGTAALANGGSGVYVATPSNTIGGASAGARNIISGNAQHGVFIIGAAATGNQVLGNYLGTTANGLSALGNGLDGVPIVDGVTNTIGGTAAGAGNVISGNGRFGVLLQGASLTGNTLAGNYIGTNAAGTARIENLQDGVRVNSANNTIGGAAPGARNVIAGNGSYGILMQGSGASGNQVQGNYIGADASGLAALRNTRAGVQIDLAPNNLIGGTAAGARNLISGNGTFGIVISGMTATGNRVQGNYIGTDASGTAALENRSSGIQLSAPNCTIGGATAGAGNLISGNAFAGLFISGVAAAPVTGAQVQGNFIGANSSGTGAIANGGSGVFITDSASNNTIGGTAAGARNLIAGNGADGIAIVGAAAPGNLVQGNYIGTNLDGTAMLANAGTGVYVESANNTIGGATPGARNLISGNSVDGVTLSQPSATGNQVLGNYIGTNFNGTTALGNMLDGVYLFSSTGNRVGGAAAGEGNIIAGNGRHGVFLAIARTNGNTVQGNYIGVAANGTTALGNGVDGVPIVGGANNLIGGSTAGTRNVIAGNGRFGVLIQGAAATGNQVSGNYIGTNAGGTAALGNAADGVHLLSSTGNFVGGSPGIANLIAFNGRNGVTVASNGNTANRVASNSIYSNGALGIDLAPLDGAGNPVFGVTANDADDVDSGPNRLVNFPVLTKAVGYAAGANSFFQLQGAVNLAPHTVFDDVVIEFYLNPACDASGNGEGKTLLGSKTVGRLGLDNTVLTFNTQLLSNVTSFNAGASITALVAYDSYLCSNCTSEFSACIPLIAPALALNDLNVNEGNSGMTNATFTVTLTGAIGALDPVTVNYATANGTALANSDYVPANGTLTFNPPFTQNTITQTIAVQVIGDTLVEGNEMFSVNLTANVGATLTDNQGVATIVDDDINCPAITLSPATLPNGQLGAAYSQQLTASGGTGPYTFSLTSGSLPGGVTLASGGLLSGTPTASGSFPVTIKATASNTCMGTQNYTLVIAACPAITVNPATLPNGTAGAAYNQTLTANGGTPAYAFTVTAGALPNGLALSTTGALTGTPTAAGAFNFTVLARDANNCSGTRAYALTINAASSGLQFFALPSPVRLLDTRPGASVNACSQPNAPIAGGTSRLQAARNFCGIPANAAALTGNVTTVNSGGGYLTLYPSGAAQPTVASTNYGVNEIINNVFTVGLGAGDGAFNIFALNTTDVVVDVTGYYAPLNTGGLYFHPLPSPVRLLETRVGQAIGCFKPGAPLPGGVDTTQQVTGVACVGIPAAARAIVGNATTVGPQAGGYLTLFPADASRPLVASSNYNANQIVNGPFTVGLSPAGQFKLFTAATTDLVVDVLGYYSTEANDANGAGLLFTPLARPVRLLETRATPPNLTGCFKPNAPLNANQVYTQPARGVCDGLTIPAAALAVVGNATVVLPQSGGYLTLWPGSAPQPTVATANYNTGEVINLHFIVGLDSADGAFKLFSSALSELVIDVSGYFAP